MKKDQEQNKDSTSTEDEQKGSLGKLFSTKNKEVAIKAIDLEDKIELERREAYIEPKTRDLLRKLLQGGDKEEIIPIYTPSLGFVYQTTDATLSENGIDKISKDFLENLAQLDILQKAFYDSVSACPN